MKLNKRGKNMMKQHPLKKVECLTWSIQLLLILLCSVSLEASEEIYQCRDFTEAKNKTRAFSGLTHPSTSLETVPGKILGSSKLQAGQIVGVKSSHGLIRTDYDPDKGPHFNATNAGKKAAFCYPGNEQSHLAAVGHLNYGLKPTYGLGAHHSTQSTLQGKTVLNRLQNMGDIQGFSQTHMGGKGSTKAYPTAGFASYQQAHHKK